MKSVKKGRLKNWRRSQFKKNSKKDPPCTSTLQYRSLLGQINRSQSRTQFQCCYRFSRCATRAASPTIETDLTALSSSSKALNKLVRQLKLQPVKLQFWPLTRPLRIIGFPDASYRNNEDGSSQKDMTEFLSELREQSWKDGMPYGGLVDYERQKDKENRTLNNRGRIVLIHESCWFMTVPSWIADGHVR